MSGAVAPYQRLWQRYPDVGGEDYIFLPHYTNRATAARIFARQFNVLLDETERRLEPTRPPCLALRFWPPGSLPGLKLPEIWAWIMRYDLTVERHRAAAAHGPQRSQAADRVLNGIFWVLRTGAPWRDLPERYGPLHDGVQPLQPLASIRAKVQAGSSWERVIFLFPTRFDFGEISMAMFDMSRGSRVPRRQDRRSHHPKPREP
jgi:transposase